MRYYTPVPLVSRALDEPTILDGVEFPEGTLITLGMYSVHHNPDVWEHPFFFAFLLTEMIYQR